VRVLSRGGGMSFFRLDLSVFVCAILVYAGCCDCQTFCDDVGDSMLSDALGDADISPDVLECDSDCLIPDCGYVPACDMILIPSGAFWMGCDNSRCDDCKANQLPYHQVTLSGYFIDRSEVTVGDYRACVNAGYCTAPVDPSENCGWLLANHEDHPMACVDWFQSQRYCEWRGKRLPTEAEWEKAARGTDGRTYPWGEDAASCEFAVTFDEDKGGRGCGTDDTMAVCSKSPAGDSPWGLCDMAGNAWERVSDWYGDSYYQESPDIDPRGPSTGVGRVSRGGTITLANNQGDLRTFNRNYHQQTATDQLLGFRCAASAQ